MFDRYTEAHWQEILYTEARAVQNLKPAPRSSHTDLTEAAVQLMVDDGLLTGEIGDDLALTDLGWSIAGRLRRWQAEGTPLAEFILFGEDVLAKALYFGCDDRAGHYWHTARMDRGRACSPPKGLVYIDGKLAPGEDRHQGADALHHIDGWTVWAMWDYSVDRRGGSNCAFAAPGRWSTAAMIVLAREVFPSVMARLDAAKSNCST